MQEQSWWTWHRTDGSAYAPSMIPAFWRRVADRRVRDLMHEFGPLEKYDGVPDRPEAEVAAHLGPGDWETLHYRLRAMARLWRPSPHAPEVHSLTPFNPLQHADASALRATLEMAATHGELAPRLDGWHLRVVPETLRAFLLMQCVGDVAERTRFRRCVNCNEWFPTARADKQFCTDACRQAHHRQSKGE